MARKAKKAARKAPAKKKAAKSAPAASKPVRVTALLQNSAKNPYFSGFSTIGADSLA